MHDRLLFASIPCHGLDVFQTGALLHRLHIGFAALPAPPVELVDLRALVAANERLDTAICELIVVDLLHPADALSY